MQIRRWVAPIAVATICLFSAACSVGDPELDRDQRGSEVVVGSGTSVQSELVADIYAGAVERAGGHAVTTPRVEDRAAYLGALDESRITLVPETSGDLLSYLDPAATESEPDAVYAALNKSLPEGLSVSDFAAAEQRPMLVLPEAAARAKDISSVADLIPHCAAMNVGVVADRPTAGVAPLETKYGCHFASVRVYAPSELSTALANGEVQAALLPAGSSVTVDGRFLALDDDEYAYRADNVLPLFRKGSLDEAEVLKLNFVAGELTTTDLAAMTSQVRSGKHSPAVALAWLDAHGV